jgi:hypothetical protein
MILTKLSPSRTSHLTPLIVRGTYSPFLTQVRNLNLHEYQSKTVREIIIIIKQQTLYSSQKQLQQLTHPHPKQTTYTPKITSCMLIHTAPRLIRCKYTTW